MTQPKVPASRRQTVSGTTPRNRRVVRMLLLFVLALIAVDGLVGDRGLLAMLRVRRQHDELEMEIARQRAENVRLAEEARRLGTDPSAIEEIARRDLGLIRPGEKIFIIKSVEAPSPQHGGPSQP